MSYEVEVKYRGVDHDQLIERLHARGAVPAAVIEQEDIYFSHPSRDFAETNEAFRVRRIGDENRITYKGPKQPGPTKTREEIEIVVGNGPDQLAQLHRLLGKLGFQHVATIHKRRECFHLVYQDHELEIALDVAESLGAFAEIEALARDAADLPTAQRAVLDLAELLGLADVEPRSYLRMVLEMRSSQPRGT